MGNKISEYNEFSQNPEDSERKEVVKKANIFNTISYDVKRSLAVLEKFCSDIRTQYKAFFKSIDSKTITMEQEEKMMTDREKFSKHLDFARKRLEELHKEMKVLHHKTKVRDTSDTEEKKKQIVMDFSIRRDTFVGYTKRFGKIIEKVDRREHDFHLGMEICGNNRIKEKFKENFLQNIIKESELDFRMFVNWERELQGLSPLNFNDDDDEDNDNTSEDSDDEDKPLPRGPSRFVTMISGEENAYHSLLKFSGETELKFIKLAEVARAELERMEEERLPILEDVLRMEVEVMHDIQQKISESRKMVRKRRKEVTDSFDDVIKKKCQEMEWSIKEEKDLGLDKKNKDASKIKNVVFKKIRLRYIETRKKYMLLMNEHEKKKNSEARDYLRVAMDLENEMCVKEEWVEEYLKSGKIAEKKKKVNKTM